MKLIKTEDGLHTIFSTKYNETYHSKHGVLQETQHVFLNGSGAIAKIASQKKISILEIGFGTGFNFFLTSIEALKNQTELDYYAVEKDLLGYDDFIGLNHHKLFSENPIWLNFLLWRKFTSNLRQGIYNIIYKNVKLFLICSDALKMTIPKNQFDAVYHDAFSPEVNAELWTTSFFEQIKHSMKNGSILSTYSAKGSVRRALIDAGFTVEKQPGSKGKREMLIAFKMGNITK